MLTYQEKYGEDGQTQGGEMPAREIWAGLKEDNTSRAGWRNTIIDQLYRRPQIAGQARTEDEIKKCDIRGMTDMRASVASPGDAMKVMWPSTSSTRLTHNSLSTLTYLRRMSHSEGQMYTALQSGHTNGVIMWSRQHVKMIQWWHHQMFQTTRFKIIQQDCQPRRTLDGSERRQGSQWYHLVF